MAPATTRPLATAALLAMILAAFFAVPASARRVNGWQEDLKDKLAEVKDKLSYANNMTRDGSSNTEGGMDGRQDEIKEKILNMTKAWSEKMQNSSSAVTDKLAEWREKIDAHDGSRDSLKKLMDRLKLRVDNVSDRSTAAWKEALCETNWADKLEDWQDRLEALKERLDDAWGNRPSPGEVESIVSVARTVDDLSTLVLAVASSPSILRAASNPDAQLTVLAPTNEAFVKALAELGMTAEQLFADKALLARILQYHIITSVVKSDAATSSGVSVPTLLPEANVTFQLAAFDGTVWVNNARVLTADIAAGKSIVHVIDTVLIPPAPTSAPEPETIASVASTVADLSILVEAVAASPAILALATDPNAAVTLFAPSNAAFAAVLAALNITKAQLLNNTELLTRILAYHVVAKPIPSSAITRRKVFVPTLLKAAFLTVQRVADEVRVYNGLKLVGDLGDGDALVQIADVEAGQSIVHVIDAVLVPADFLLSL
ncbi:hypothetical protein FOA52_008240 [Chlamydomonas sp. UWO 241]|nr:hypothetical protein FOA52_008240 [Chlamydomonas sp. UWO 241]